MSDVPDEVLMAYADGELTPEESQTLERMLRRDPVLRARVEPFIRTREHLASAFDGTLHEPVPERLVAAIRRASPPARLSLADTSAGSSVRDILRAAFALLAPAGFSFTPALAAGVTALVVTGAAIGWMAGSASVPSSLIAASGADLVATGALARALEANPSGAAARTDEPHTTVVPVLSFNTADGTVCREYRIRSAEADRDFAGLACRNADGVWHVAQHVQTPKQATAQSDGTYQTATGANVPAVDAMVETMMSGEALGADDEAKLLGSGWRGSR